MNADLTAIINRLNAINESLIDAIERADDEDTRVELEAARSDTNRARCGVEDAIEAAAFAVEEAA